MFYNNFLLDPERPQNAELKRTALGGSTSLQSTSLSVPLSDERRQGGGDFERGGFRGGWSGGDRGGGGGGQRFMSGGARPFGQGGFGGGGGFNARFAPRYFDGDGARRPQQPPANPDRPQTSYRDLDAVDEVF